jgi:tRNA 2-selenouridine synthase
MPAMSNLSRQHNRQLVDLNALGGFDDIIDVRTPSEFADDHIPGAINAPVLSDEERKLVGTIYARESAFKATRLGAALVARRIAEHLDGPFADKPRDWKPLIYCWRGGKRSGSMTTWFNLIGWKALQLDGGYKTWRRHVMQGLGTLPAGLNFVVLTGPTGSGKTRLLQSLAKAGAQTLDLEALACHRGSLLGELPDCPQPGQRQFETSLFSAIRELDAAQPVFVEAESRRIGQRDLPASLMQAMHRGQCVRVQVAMPKRVEFLLQDYEHLFATPDHFKHQLGYLVSLHGHKTIDTWQAMIDDDRRAELFQVLMECHYDPAYRRSSNSHFLQLPNALVFDYDPTKDNFSKDNSSKEKLTSQGSRQDTMAAGADASEARRLLEQLGVVADV